MSSLGKSILAAELQVAGGALSTHAALDMEPIWQQAAVITHTQLLTRSYRRLTGRDLLPGQFNPLGLARNLFLAPFVLVSHGTEADPILNYGNQAALNLWELTWEELTRTPSRLTAETPERAERARLLAAVTAHGFIDDYSGVRISKSGRRFRIARATVWNLIGERGEPCGQAATFDRWEFL
jgi:hypothetical protein